MSELKEYFKDMDMQWEVKNYDSLSDYEKKYYKDTVGFRRWKATRDLKEAIKSELTPIIKPFADWLNDKCKKLGL